MHTHFQDGDWQAAIERYNVSVALPKELIVPGLDKTRKTLSGNIPNDQPNVAGKSFEQVLSESKSAEATKLRDAIVQGRWTVTQVMEAFLVKAALAQQVLGCYAEIYFDRSLQRAKELDALLTKSKDVAQLGSLFGVPISIKAHLGLEGSGSDRGFVFDVLDQESTDAILTREESKSKDDPSRLTDSTLALLRKQGTHVQTVTGHAISMLLEQGAIIIAKTTMPQSIMQLDTRSNLHGQTLNPRNVHLSPGGSSGGEAASVSSGATLLGVGTDIGGSVRQPAACVGLYGLRPTIGRINNSGTRTTMLGNEGILGTMGPFARSLQDLELLTSVLVKDSTRSDPHLCPPLPWTGFQKPTVDAGKKLNVGVLLDDGFVQPITPIRRAMHDVIEKLQASGKVNIVYVNPADYGERGWWMARQLYFMENGELLRSLASLTGEPLMKLTEYVFSPPVHLHSASDIWLLQYQREAFKKQFWQHVFVNGGGKQALAQPLDVLLCPAAALAAARPQQIYYWGYTSLFNLTDLPGVTFPVAGYAAQAEKDKAFEATKGGKLKPSISDLDQGTIKEYETYREVFENAPIGLQLIGHRFREEELLGTLAMVEDIIGNKK
ncbi:amidase signature enzyme [Meira miltonrushii]|uniref:amidase n=1 Tax=Meira miltonrushii TaxID=1280837 RepID=A0A316VFW2_9BASI|nr:amidase signature enzyme [Meira miltonrushii]PWN35203.1 amidase signature enzyme [Meira miltonrushii]